MAMRLIEGRQITDGVFPAYELTVEHISWFGFVRRIQKYRGNYAWKLYPQGYDADAVVIQPWLDAQVQQYRWSLEARS